MTVPLPSLRLRSTFTALLLSDFCALCLSLAVSYLLRALGEGELLLEEYVGLVPFFCIFLLLYGALGVYPGVLQPPNRELKSLAIGTSIGFLWLGFFLFLGRQGFVFSRFVVLCSWALSLGLVPLLRFFTRKCCTGKSWWGYPVVCFAFPDDAENILRLSSLYRERGLFIVKTVRLHSDGSIAESGGRSDGEVMESLAGAYPDSLAFLLAGALPLERVQALIFLMSRYFRRIAIRINTPWLVQSSLRMASLPCGPVLSLRQNLLDPTRMRMKRCLDLAFCLLGGIFFLFAIPVIALCIRLDSGGPVFFIQKRVGQHGKSIRVYKFRTMVENSRDVLAGELRKNPALRDEWIRTRKLVRDPRLTRAGRFLRRTSLDELPQIFNVLKGDMSLVGPRPIVQKEIARYGEIFPLYTQVKPGITGLWQISGRNDVSYVRRVELDQFYVYNWSVWLDLYILIRTIPTVISGKGAY